jgi:hypothetical protein
MLLREVAVRKACKEPSTAFDSGSEGTYGTRTRPLVSFVVAVTLSAAADG